MMMNQYPHRDHGRAVKWIIFFILILLIALIVLVVLAVNPFNPQTIANANRTYAETQVFLARQGIILDYELRLYEMRLPQAAEDFQRMEAVKEWAARYLTFVVSIPLALAAFSFAALPVALAVAAGTLALRQIVHLRMARRSQSRVRVQRELYQLLSDINHRMLDLAVKAAAENQELQNNLSGLEVQVVALETALSELRTLQSTSPNGANGQSKSPILFPTGYRHDKYAG